MRDQGGWNSTTQLAILSAAGMAVNVDIELNAVSPTLYRPDAGLPVTLPPGFIQP
jgi:hypothetical protein